MEPNRRPNRCLVCFQNHHLRSCEIFLSFTVKQRLYSVRAHRYCANCLSPSHHVQNCTVAAVCRKCRGTHHTLLHQDRPSGSSQVASQRRSVQDRLTVYRQEEPQTLRRLQRSAQRPSTDNIRQQRRTEEASGIVSSRRRRPRNANLQRHLDEQARGQATTHQLLRQMIESMNRLTETIAPVQGGRHVQARNTEESEIDEEDHDFDIMEPLL